MDSCQSQGQASFNRTTESGKENMILRMFLFDLHTLLVENLKKKFSDGE